MVRIGNKQIGDGSPILVQSMTNTPTMDTMATVEQCIRLFSAGAELVRITTRNLEEAENLANIRRILRERGYPQPLCADVHFNPAVAETAARLVEKVRINPGNYGTGRPLPPEAYTEEVFLAEQEQIRKNLRSLLATCRQHGTALRIGVNHGSLSARMMARYGDTPEGMAESAMEFIRLCREENFHNLVISMKASNVRIIVYATRLVVQKMKAEGALYPVHLGVTEAGEGEDGRIRSAAGIGTLLAEGIGDTIRVSLTEDPVEEIPVAQQLVKLAEKWKTAGKTEQKAGPGKTTFEPRPVNPLPGHVPALVIADSADGTSPYQTPPDILFLTQPSLLLNLMPGQMYLCDHEAWADLFTDVPNIMPLVPAEHFEHFVTRILPRLPAPSAPASQPPESPLTNPQEPGVTNQRPVALLASPATLTPILPLLQNTPSVLIVLQSFSPHPSAEFRDALSLMEKSSLRNPVVLNLNYATDDADALRIQASAEAAPALIDGLANGIWLRNAGTIAHETVVSAAMGILQACRLRTFRTDYIACPSCGRTLFNIMDVLRKVKERTHHLSHLKIAVMGCIVNGPGEMADADYGYVGAGPGRVTIYKGKNPVRKNIHEENAIAELIQVIKENGDWMEVPHPGE